MAFDPKKLVIDLEKVEIDGGVELLNEPVEFIDITIEKIYNNTLELAEILTKYFEGNKGNQYEVLASHAKNLSVTLDEASETMNKEQHEIVAFQEATNRFNDENRELYFPRQRETIVIDPQVMSSYRYVDIETIRLVQAKAVDYCEEMRKNLKSLLAKKDEIHSFWHDPQYNNFSEYINELVEWVGEYVKVFDGYADYLHGKIEEYANYR